MCSRLKMQNNCVLQQVGNCSISITLMWPFNLLLHFDICLKFRVAYEIFLVFFGNIIFCFAWNMYEV